VNRVQLRQLAEVRILEAGCLRNAGHWSGAYYLAGYSVECGLKACILAHVDASGAIFQDKRFSERCWTHDFVELLRLASLTPVLSADAAANAVLSTNWGIVKDWRETSRYGLTSQAEADLLYNAIVSDPNEVLPWLRIRW
jgi:hypothetical protein